ncbi:MAG: glycine C-acetyltransferase, partial [Actinomycetota bacterium]|nr:glycine C-acetyltransferase [Actinomycetota bacterium]
MPSRPDLLVAVLGTATGVGKTWATAALVQALRDTGVNAVARKPVQSYARDDASATDAHLLAVHESPEDVCPPHRWYEVAMAPPMAADALGRPPFTVADLMAELTWPPATQVGLVETVGGPRSPVAADGDSLDLAAALHPDLVVLVADAGLGAVNAVRL